VLETLMAGPPGGERQVLLPGTVFCGGIACFVILNPKNVTDVLGPIKTTGSSTEAITIVGDASLGGANVDATPETVYPCFRTDPNGAWQPFPDAVMDLTWVQTNTPVPQARTGFLNSTTNPPLEPGTAYFVALCGGTQITSSPTNSWVDHAKVVVMHLP
jgi:hypothetical protein